MDGRWKEDVLLNIGRNIDISLKVKQFSKIAVDVCFLKYVIRTLYCEIREMHL